MNTEIDQNKRYPTFSSIFILIQSW